MYKYKAANKNIEISNPDKVLFPDIGFTKSDLVEYYTGISACMLRHLKQRPVNMKRAPDGTKGGSFYQQSAGNYFPSWVETVEVAKSDGSLITHVVCDDKKTLAVMANLACITIHIWLSRTSSLENPDKIIFDLDPPEGKGFRLVNFGAQKIRIDTYSLPCILNRDGIRDIIQPDMDDEEKKLFMESAYVLRKYLEKLDI